MNIADIHTEFGIFAVVYIYGDRECPCDISHPSLMCNGTKFGCKLASLVANRCKLVTSAY